MINDDYSDLNLNLDRLLTLEQYKTKKIQQVSQMSFTLRERLFSDSQYMNAIAGVYDTTPHPEKQGLNKNNAIATVAAFRNEFYRLQQEINSAITKEEIDNIIDNNRFPNDIVVGS